MPGEANYKNAKSRNPTKTLLSNRKITVGGCWKWTGPICAKYGRFTLPENEETRVHRIAFRLWIGSIPVELQVNHSCDNPLCFNPDHLYLGTQKENMEDKWSRGRGRVLRGMQHPQTRLTEDNVASIRLSPDPQSVLAARFGVSQSHISRIRGGLRRTTNLTVSAVGKGSASSR